MNTIAWVVLAFVVFNILQNFLTNRKPIPETSVKVHKITAPAELVALLSSTSRVVVDFYADWCPPCRAIAPVFSSLADEHATAGELAFAKINVDHVKEVAGLYNVTAMPTFVVFRSGKPGAVKAEGVRAGAAVLDSEGRVERIRGADRGALMAVVKALAGEVGEKKE